MSNKPEMSDAEKEANAKLFERNKQLYQDILGAWGSGQFNSTNPDAAKVAAKMLSANIVNDTRYPATYEDAFKVYNGPEGCLEWCQYLEKNWDFPDFTVNGIFPGPKGEVWSLGSYTPVHKPTGRTGVKIDWMQRVGFDDEGKCTYFKFHYGPTAMYEDMLAAPNEAALKSMEPTPPMPAAGPKDDSAAAMAAWGALMASWGSGATNVPVKADGIAEISKLCTTDCVFDVRYPAAAQPGLSKIYKGHEGVWQWCRLTTGWDMPDFSVEHVVEGPDGSIICCCGSSTTVKATGKTAARSESLWRFVARDGKIAHVTAFWSPDDTMDVNAAHIPDASRFFTVEHTFKPGKADEFWANTQKMMSDPETMTKWTLKQRELGFANYSFMPAGGDKPMLCVWECKEGTSVEAFQKFIDGPDGPGDTCLRNDVYPTLPGAVLPGSSFVAPELDILPARVQTKGSFFWVHHEFKSPDAAKEFWTMMQGMNATTMKQMEINNIKLGFYNHTFMPSSQEGPAFCTWECAKDISADEFQKFIDGPDGPGAGKIFNNAVHKVPKGQGMNPTAKFTAPVEGLTTVKTTPPTAAVTANRGVAA